MSTETALALILGWALGLMGGPIAEAIRRGRRRGELKDALRDELREFRQLMASLVYRLSDWVGALDVEVVEWLLEVHSDRAMTAPDALTLEAFQGMRDRLAAGPPPRQQNQVVQGGGLSLKVYNLPLLSAAIPELSVFDADTRRRLLQLHERLDLWNQEVPRLAELFNRTFDSDLSAHNRQVVLTNLDAGYREQASRARAIADQVASVLDKW
jgi:hypothetical protein